MREIKFRAWNKLSNSIWEWEHIINYNYSIKFLFTDTFELMQYTGLKDKNGREIYEGDIVQPYSEVYLKGLSMVDSPQIVKYDAPGFLPFDLPCHGGEIYMTDMEFEVIGNIRENPELLESE